MARYLVAGSQPLHGSTKLPGAKNAVTKLLIASLLSDQVSTLHNFPEILEINLTMRLLRSFGAKIDKIGPGSLNISRGTDFTNTIPAAEAALNRMAVLTVAPLLHCFKEVKLPKNMGGDKIGPRPIDFHIGAYQSFGATITEDDENFHFKCDQLKGTTLELPYPSVSTTENILLAASLAEGTTVLKNAAIEPEVIDLVLFLQKMGAIIDIQTDRRIVIEGVKELRSTEHRVLPDRIVCASYGALAIASGGQIEVKDARQDHMLSFLNNLRRMNAPFEITSDGIIFGNGKKNKLVSINLETHVHPGFMTDWQPPMVILMTQANGLSTLHETVYQNRLSYTKTLVEMGANIQNKTQCLGGIQCRFLHKDFEHSCIVSGATKLKGIKMDVPDLRAGFSYIIAALCAEGSSEINHVEEIERGYGNLDEVLKGLGAPIERKD
jgi:UDP-N-acetylglucosamine 1-carboxyvinyltransferase